MRIGKTGSCQKKRYRRCETWTEDLTDLHIKALPLLKAAYDRGLNTWDTADIYSNGVSEEIIAKAIKQYKIPRDKVVILTKCFAYLGEEPGV